MVTPIHRTCRLQNYRKEDQTRVAGRGPISNLIFQSPCLRNAIHPQLKFDTQNPTLMASSNPLHLLNVWGLRLKVGFTTCVLVGFTYPCR